MRTIAMIARDGACPGVWSLAVPMLMQCREYVPVAGDTDNLSIEHSD